MNPSAAERETREKNFAMEYSRKPERADGLLCYTLAAGFGKSHATN